MKKITVLMCLFFLIFLPSNCFADNSNNGVYIVDGNKKTLSSTGIYINDKIYGASVLPALNIDGRIYMASRDVATLTNANISFDKKSKQVIIQKDNNKIIMKQGESKCTINGTKTSLPKGCKVYNVNQYTVLPIGFISAQTGLNVAYDNFAKTVRITEKSDLKATDLINIASETDTKDNKNKPAKTDDIKKSENKKEENTDYLRELSVSQENNKTLFKYSIILSDTVNYDVVLNKNVVKVSVKNSKLKNKFINKLYDKDEFINFVNYEYDDKNKISEFVIEINPDIDMKKVNISKNNRGIVISYKVTVQKTEIFHYETGRSISTLTIPLKTSSVINSFNEDGKFIIKVPHSLLPTENYDFTPEKNDRNVTSIQAYEEGDETVINVLLKDRVSCKVVKDGSDGTIIVDFVKGNHEPPKIYLDPGHGGKDSGAVGNGIYEKDVVLPVSLMLADKLRNAGYEVIMSRDSDTYPTLEQRAAEANDCDADLFISIHANSADKNSSAYGVETYYYSGDDSKKIANLALKELVASTGSSDRGSKKMGYLVIKRTYMPATLLELGFISNPKEAKDLNSPEYQEKCADAVFTAINTYFGR